MDDSSSTERLLTTLRGDVAQLAPGDRLPSSRDLIARLGVSPVTVARAIARLAGEGVVVTRPGSGTFVARGADRGRRAGRSRLAGAWRCAIATARRRSRSARCRRRTPDAIALGGGYLHADAAADAGAGRGPGARRPPPRRLGSRPGGRSAGAARAVRADVRRRRDRRRRAGDQRRPRARCRSPSGPSPPPATPVLVESPTYPGAIAAARAAGLRTDPGADRRRRRPARPARRRLRAERRPRLLRAADVPQPDRLRAGAGAAPAGRSTWRGRPVRSSSRTTAPGISATAPRCRDRWSPTIATATSCR